MKRYLIDEACELEPGTGPWTFERHPQGEGPSGENWLIADFGVAIDPSGVEYEYFLTTDHVHASEDTGSPETDIAWVIWCRNHWGSIKEALDANRSPAGTDQEKIEAAELLRAWNNREPIRAKTPDAEVIVLALQQGEDIP